MTANVINKKTSQTGTAIVVGLVLLIAVTLLATASARTANSELQITRSHQTHQMAFQAAETGLEHMLAARTFETAGPTSDLRLIDAYTTVNTRIEYVGQSSVPDATPDADVTGLVAYHFVGTATATVRRIPGTPSNYDTSTVHVQSFYIVGPASTASPPPTITIVQNPVRQVCVGSDCIESSLVSLPARSTWHVADSG